jgi:hypothetical protein
MSCENHTFNSNKESFDWDKNMINNCSDNEIDRVIKINLTKRIEKFRPDKARSKSELTGNGDILSWKENKKSETVDLKFTIKKRNPNLKSSQEFSNTGSRFNKSMMTSKDNVFYTLN